MNSLDLLEPLKSYNSFLKDDHNKNVNEYFDELTKKSGVNVEANREICKRYYAQEKKVADLNKKLGKNKGMRTFMFVLRIISIVAFSIGLIVAILSLVSKTKTSNVPIIVGFAVAFVFLGLFILTLVLRKKYIGIINNLETILNEENSILTNINKEAWSSMTTLNALFDDFLPSKLFEKTAPLIQMDDTFTTERLSMMEERYGFNQYNDNDASTIAVQSGTILGNPFFFERSYNMHMVDHVYEGTLVITWTTTSRDSKGNVYTHTHTQTLRATVTKPRPEYYNHTKLVYANMAAEHLSFSRDPSALSNKEHKDIEKYVRKHEKDLSKMAEKALKKGQTFTPLGNSEFEFVFGGLDRDHEVEYRLLFTPLAQKAMLDLIETKEPYGDDFSLYKNKCINTVVSTHDQNLNLFENANNFVGFDYDKVRDHFVNYNNEYFKAVFFDFAPLLCIPLYQQNKAREYIYKDNYKSNYTVYEAESLANKLSLQNLIHPKTKTDVILKTNVVKRNADNDVLEVTAHSFDEIPELTLVPVLGGDGKMHNVPVHWFSYKPLKQVTPMVMSQVGGTYSKFRGSEFYSQCSSSGDVAYTKGFFSYIPNTNNANVDINSLKDKMSK